MKKQLNIGFAESSISHENPYLQYDELEKIILQNKMLDLICFPELYLISDSKSKYVNENILADIFDRIDYLHFQSVINYSRSNTNHLLLEFSFA